ncbi:RNA polymerase sigma factor RpoS [Paenibacillus polymyxa]|uniref:sigma-70 family RNA polymerase sigma factor n=1 Tax=Paenibacillus polymyxa TaxID=1406 RepID=UPI0008FB6DB3|nr:sigma-70 family RNA polymerase sigma factor [Paenibacillus polymyxa]APB77415.1 RNA polymerase sigma factor RpoS [Paenibacillus polymyxa]
MSTLMVDKGNWVGDRHKPFPFYNPSLGDIDTFVEKNMNLVRKIAYSCMSKTNLVVDVEDLIQEGVIGLMRAYQMYDPAKGAASTIATFHIRARILAYIRDDLPLIRKPAWVYEIMGNILIRKIEDNAPDQIAKTINRPVETVKMILDTYAWKMIYSDGLSEFDKGIDFDEMTIVFQDFSNELTALEKKVLLLKMSDMTHREIASKLGYSPGHIGNTIKKIGKKALMYFREEGANKI